MNTMGRDEIKKRREQEAWKALAQKSQGKKTPSEKAITLQEVTPQKKSYASPPPRSKPPTPDVSKYR